MINNMKPKGPELGSLSSRFFAYVQLKKLDIIRTGEIAPILEISALQERDLFRRLSDSGWILMVIPVSVDIPRNQRHSKMDSVKKVFYELEPIVPGLSFTGAFRGHNESRQYIGYLQHE